VQAEHLIEFLEGKRVITLSNGTENFGIEIYLVERHAVVDAKIETLTHRAHLHRRADPRNPRNKATTRPDTPA
jgi:hypothetical protein